MSNSQESLSIINHTDHTKPYPPYPLGQLKPIGFAMLPQCYLTSFHILRHPDIRQASLQLRQWLFANDAKRHQRGAVKSLERLALTSN